MGFVKLLCILLAVFIFHAKATLTIPGDMISPLGIPGAMGPAGMNALKLAVGSRLLTMLGSISPGSPIDLIGSQFGSQFMGAGFPFRFDPITARSKDFAKRRGPSIPTTFDIRTASPTEIENFFAVLHKVDANKCISRLVCEVGADSTVLKDLGHNIKDVMSSLEILEKNALSTKYREILLQGQEDGFDSCSPKFDACDQRSYRLVRTFVRAFRVRN